MSRYEDNSSNFLIIILILVLTFIFFRGVFMFLLIAAIGYFVLWAMIASMSLLLLVFYGAIGFFIFSMLFS